jgi:hypothetical protein
MVTEAINLLNKEIERIDDLLIRKTYYGKLMINHEGTRENMLMHKSSYEEAIKLLFEHGESNAKIRS